MTRVASVARDLVPAGDYPGVLVKHSLRHRDGSSLLALAFRVTQGELEDQFLWREFVFTGPTADMNGMRAELRDLGILWGRMAEVGSAMRAAYGTHATVRVRLVACRNTFELRAPEAE